MDGTPNIFTETTLTQPTDLGALTNGWPASKASDDRLQ